MLAANSPPLASLGTGSFKMSSMRLAGLAAFGIVVGAASGATATPFFQIVDSVGNPRTAPPGGNCTPGSPTQCEVIGDAGGTHIVWPHNTPGGGPGIPTANGGWPNGGGIAADPSFGNARGTSGWHASYLRLTQPGRVTFQFMGAGDSSFVNVFWINPGSGFVPIFLDGQATSPTIPCAVGPGVLPVCDNPVGGFPIRNMYNGVFGAGLIAFGFGINSNVLTLINDGTSNGDVAQAPGFFLGMDPYMVGVPFQNAGFAAYVGLTDQASLGDHDFQDMVVRITVSGVPEPTSWALLLGGFGLVGFAMRNRRDLQSTAA